MKANPSVRARLFVNCPLSAGADVGVSDDQRHYLLHVMRVQAGEILHVFNGQDGLWRAEITTVSKRDISVRAHTCIAEQAASPDLTVCIAPIKGGRFEGMVEKATELGARCIFPVQTKRTVITRINETRLAATAREAAEQCERLDMPEIASLTSFAEFLHSWPQDKPLIYADETGAHGAFAPTDALISAARIHGYGVLIGPEGGFTPEELASLAAQKSAYGVSLGPRILRADTACTSLCAITMHHLGDWHARPTFRHAAQTNE